MLTKVVTVLSVLYTCSCIHAEELSDSSSAPPPPPISSRVDNSLSSGIDDVSLPNKSDFDSGLAAVKRTRNVNRRISCPSGMAELHVALARLAEKVRTDEKPDSIDMILLVDTNGKTQTATAVRFLANLENELIRHAEERNPALKMKLACVFDSFVAAGSGVIPASIGALGNITQEEALPTIWEMPSKMLYPKSIGGFFSCCGCVGDTTEAIVSAYFDTPEIIDKDSPDWDSLTYDAFNFEKSGGRDLLELYGASTTDDLKSSLEVISLHDSDSVIGLILNTIAARDNDARSHVKRVAVAEAFSTAESILSMSSKVSKNSKSSRRNSHCTRRLEMASRGIEQMSMVLKKSSNKRYGTITKLKESLINRVDIPRDTLVLSVTADTFSGKIIVPSFSYDVKQTDDGKYIVNLNYRFALPSMFYDPKRGELEAFQSAIDTCVNSVFPSRASRRTNVSMATEMLIEFLNGCNDRVIQAIEQE